MKMKRMIGVLTALLLFYSTVFAQHKTENLVIVNLDGMRWQEIFKGVDEVLMNDSMYNRGIKEMKEKFWAETEEERRRKLFPFLWNVIGQEGQLYGNRKYDNKVDNAN